MAQEHSEQAFELFSFLGTRKADLDQVSPHDDVIEIATYRLRAGDATTGTSQSQGRPAPKAGGTITPASSRAEPLQLC